MEALAAKEKVVGLKQVRRAVASGKVNLKGIVSNIFNFDDIQAAMDKSVSDKANIVKSVVKIG